MLLDTTQVNAETLPRAVEQLLRERVDALVNERLDQTIAERVAAAMKKDPAKNTVAIIASKARSTWRIRR